MLSTTSFALEIVVSGAVNNQGSLVLANNARIINALVKARPTGQSFPLGGMLLRANKLTEQTSLKAGLLYDLRTAGNNHFSHQIPGLSQKLTRLYNIISQLAPTGRVKAEFNIPILNSDIAKNTPLKNLDHIHIPSRPKGIYVLGAVEKSGLYNFKNKSVVNVTRKIKHQSANPDWAWVIQPDSSVERVGVALWNQQLEKVAAIGAIIFIPFADKVFAGTDNFNQQMATFLGTQNVSALSAQP